jgi:endonuclease YncB( thermonuclease family)
VRLVQAGAPEKRQPFGERSRQRLAVLCLEQQAEIRPQDQDRDGRTVAHVHCAGQDAAEQQMRADCRGSWAGQEPGPPWEWRSQ